MAEEEEQRQQLLLSSMISDIKNYTGDDPLRPWLRGIRRMKQSLPPQIYNQKLPRFLQKCVQTFQTDRLYRNDTRYIQIWIQLMDLVDDPRGLLKRMEMNKIGTKKALFYQAYALYYEKRKKYDEAEKMYHLGVSNLAQPIEKLKKTYIEFLERMAQRKKKKAQREELRAGNKICKSILRPPKKVGESKEDFCDGDSSGCKEVLGATESRSFLKPLASRDRRSSKESSFSSDETVVGKFIGTAIVRKSEAEDACHHGLVDPTINLKEAMNAINSMFREPIDIEPVRRRKLNKSPAKVEHKMTSGFEVFVDEGSDDGASQTKENSYVPHIAVVSNPVKEATLKKIETRKPLQETFQIFVDDEEGSGSSEGNGGGFVFLTPTDDSDDEVAESAPPPRLLRREDTVVGRFVGSTILDDHVEVENACHHGLVEPTVNMKEAMDDINGMFGKPLDFGRATRPKKFGNLPNKKKDYGGFSILPDDSMEQQQQAQPKNQAELVDKKLYYGGGFSILPDDNMEQQQQPQQKKQMKLPNNKMDFGGFSILPDDDMEQEPQSQLKKQAKLPTNKMEFCGFSILPDDDVITKQPQPSSSCVSRSGSEYDLHEPTVFTKQAMYDINEMFGKPLW
ncbi:hypothetical protein MKX01_009311 [Papaver californicum]|nr:hypothetical protein MKX01_009311 [Papaver californicum]